MWRYHPSPRHILGQVASYSQHLLGKCSGEPPRLWEGKRVCWFGPDEENILPLSPEFTGAASTPNLGTLTLNLRDPWFCWQFILQKSFGLSTEWGIHSQSSLDHSRPSCAKSSFWKSAPQSRSNELKSRTPPLGFCLRHTGGFIWSSAFRRSAYWKKIDQNVVQKV